METRFRILHFISLACKVFGSAAIVVSILQIWGSVVSPYFYSPNIFAPLLTIAPSAITAVLFFGAGHLIDVLLSTEENMRTALEYDEQMVKLMQRMIQEQSELREAITSIAKAMQPPAPPQP